jgi:hypothetical protein
VHLIGFYSLIADARNNEVEKQNTSPADENGIEIKQIGIQIQN